MKTFVYRRTVAFCDTDAMGIVHHSNYIRYCEEARVAWMRDRGLRETHFPEADAALAVLEMRVQHLLPLRFGDDVVIRLQVKRERLKFHYRYAIYSDKSDEVVALGETVHVAVNHKMRPVRPARKFLETLEKEPWTETWP